MANLHLLVGFKEHGELEPRFIPPSMLHMILSKVCEESVRDHGAARSAFRGFNEVGREDHFYRSANLFLLNDWIPEINGVITFKIRCYQMGNPMTFYLRGMYEFFMLYLLDEGREKINIAADRGCEVAKYVDSMLNLAFNIDERGRVHNYPNFSREYVDQMSYMISRWGGHYDYEKPVMFLEIMEKIDSNCAYDCWCSKREPRLVYSIDGSITHWTCDRCFLQSKAWRFCDEINSTARAWPIKE